MTVGRPAVILSAAAISFGALFVVGRSVSASSESAARAPQPPSVRVDLLREAAPLPALRAANRPRPRPRSTQTRRRAQRARQPAASAKRGRTPAPGPARIAPAPPAATPPAPSRPGFAPSRPAPAPRPAPEQGEIFDDSG